MMQTETLLTGWKRVAPTLDVELQHGVPVHIYSTDSGQAYDNQQISDKVRQLTGLTVSVHDGSQVSTKDHEWSICVDKKEFKKVLHRLALASAAMFVDRFHKPIDDTAVDWNRAEFTYDFNHAMEHCCIALGSLDKPSYFQQYVEVMRKETVRLLEAGISPLVDAEQ